jgi:hypothetical protein
MAGYLLKGYRLGQDNIHTNKLSLLPEGSREALQVTKGEVCITTY